MADDVPELVLEEPGLVRRDELARRVARPPIHTVVHERHARLATRQPEHQHERDARRARPRAAPTGADDALRERGMSAHVGHGEAAEVVPRLEAVDGLRRARATSGTRSPSARGASSRPRSGAGCGGSTSAGSRELLLHAARSADGSLTAVLPLYAWRRRFPRVAPLPRSRPGRRARPGPRHEASTTAAARALAHRARRARLGRVLRRAAARRRGLARAPRRPHVAARGEPVAARFLRQLGRVPRRAEPRTSASSSAAARRHSAEKATSRLRLADATTLDRDLDALFALHRARWGSTPTDFGDTPFHRELAREALGRGWLRLWLLELDGRPIAAWHGFQVGAVASYYQAGRDPAFERHSVGFVLMAPLDSLGDRGGRDGVPVRDVATSRSSPASPTRIAGWRRRSSRDPRSATFSSPEHWTIRAARRRLRR